MKTKSVRVWDLPTRIFHWSLVLATAGVFATGLIGGNLMVWHGRLGVLIAGLLVFRLVWGFVGSTHARFARFFPRPGSILAYLGGQWQGLGHNPLGALSVFALLAVLFFQVGSGLVANDDIAFEGPLYALVGKDTSDWLVGLHRQNVWLVGALVIVHVLAIVFYAVVKKEGLVRPMITGVKRVDDAAARDAEGGSMAGLMLALIVAVLAIWGASGAWIPAPPPPPPQSVPAW